MPVPRQVDLRRDVPGVLLAATTLLVAASLATFHPADPVTDPVWPFSRLITPSTPCFPVADDFQNACGALGALVADGLSQSLGSTALLIPLATGVLAVCYLLRINIAGPAIRSLGGTLFLIAAATGASMLPSMTPLDPVTGGGGNFGAMTSTLLLDHFHPGGSWILTLTVAAVGTLLVSDYFVLHASAVAASTAATGGRKVYEVAKAVPLRRRKPFAGDDLIQLHGEASEPHSPHAGPTIRVLAAKRKPRSEGGEADTSWEDTVLDPQPEPESKAATGQTRQIEAEDETMMLRRDEPEAAAPPPPKIRMATRKRSDREKLNDEVHEDAPASLANYVLPPIDLLEIGDDVSYDEQLEEVRRKAVQLEQTFESFGFNVRVVDIEVGPVIAQYEIELESGLRISKIASLENDIAIALRAPSVRIVAPIPGKNTVGIEIPNEARQTVHLRDVIEEADDKVAKLNIPVFLGKDVSGNPMVVDLAKMPHLLIAGRTGTGKSVCLNAIIASILMKCRPDDVRMLMIDPKMVELSGYGRLPHLMHPVITDMKKAEAILAWAVDKMEERYSMLAKVGVRHINSYNELGREELYNRLEIDEDEDGVTPDVPVKLPFIVIIADEMADLMMTAGKEVETHIIRLAQKSRAVGIHLILATQKPTVDVITGLIKSNLPARLSFQVASKTDSRVVLDENGADKLLGNGDMLFLWPGTSTVIRGQGTYLSDDEIDRVCNHCGTGEQKFVGELMNLKVAGEGSPGELDVESLRKKDELYESAIEVVIREGRGSLSLIQRCLGIGYGRAARLVDYMAEDGIVGEYNGSKSREVILTMAEWQRMQGIEPQEEAG